VVIDAILDTSVLVDLLRGFQPAKDAMIASVAARLAVPLYTTNLKHFQPLPSLDAKRPY
jgi:predicted nucleic acid-binding protein